MNSLYLVDGNNMVHRCYHATKKVGMTNGDIPTGAIYGFQRTMKAMIRDLGINNLVVFFDHKGRLDRHNIYDEYKANRSHNEEVSIQYPHIITWCWLYGISTFSIQGYEADDLIYTAQKNMYDDFDHIYIVSNDKDLCQLVDEKTSVIDPMNSYAKVGPKEVYDKFGVLPSGIRMFLSIAGDNSDNIPGCKGIGKVGAKRIVNEYGTTFNDVYGKISEIEKKTAEKLISSIENVRMSYELIGLMYIDNLEIVSKIRQRDEGVLKDFYSEMKIKGD